MLLGRTGSYRALRLKKLPSLQTASVLENILELISGKLR